MLSIKEENPKEVFQQPVVVANPAPTPTPTLLNPAALHINARHPTATFCTPVETISESCPTAVFEFPVAAHIEL
jgi:hypothetical protein